MLLPYSPLARRVPGVRDPKLARKRTPWGLLLHTTGGGITAKAKREGRKPIDVAIEYYISSQNGANGYTWGGPAYVLDHDGTLYQIAPDDAVTHHAGGTNGASYRAGTWTGRLSAEAVAQWKKRWPERAHPYALFPSASPNIDYVGVEMIPVGDGFGEPMRKGLRFTRAQHNTAIALGVEMGLRHQWAPGWANAASGRLVGHEDVDPLERSDANGGWDPGANRAAPYFDFDYVRRGINGIPIALLAAVAGVVIASTKLFGVW